MKQYLRAHRQNILAMLIVLTICFIWGNSLLPPELSGRISQAVTELLGMDGIGATDEHPNGETMVRKMVHFVEFAVLGVLLRLYLICRNPDRVSALCFYSICGLFFPLMDETLQTFSNRGASISDVWLDIGGYVFGVVACIVACSVITRIKRGRCRGREVRT